VIPIFLPKVGQKFRNLDDAWLFWVNYGGHAGFEIRKRYSWTSKMDGKVTSCRYVCAKEGHRAQDKRDHLTKNPRGETRTGCDVHMCLSLDRVEGHYEVVDVMLDHNHGVYLPETFHLMLSQRKISDLQAFEIEAADDSGIRTKAAHELANRTVGGRMNLSYTCRDQRNHL
jgi:zinc finger SWIM domain-containing protein 3